MGLGPTIVLHEMKIGRTLKLREDTYVQLLSRQESKKSVSRSPCSGPRGNAAWCSPDPQVSQGESHPALMMAVTPKQQDGIEGTGGRR